MSKDKKNDVVTEEKDPKDLTLDPKGIPATMSFEEMQKAVAEFKKLQKIIKAMPKEDRAKLLPPVKAREIPESLTDLAEIIFEKVTFWKENLKSEFAKTVTLDKPDGNKSISLSNEDCDFSIAIIRKSKKETK
jgi:hypothetical protein